MIMFYDYMLKFNTEAECTQALYTEETWNEQTILVPKYVAVDVIGTVYEPTGNTISTEHGDVPEMSPVSGWHANVRHNKEAPELVAYQVFPVTPVRVWA
jgi:hypothetical protein